MFSNEEPNETVEKVLFQKPSNTKWEKTIKNDLFLAYQTQKLVIFKP